MANIFNLEDLKASNFATDARTHLCKAFELLTGIKPDDSMTNDYLRAELRGMNKLEAIVASAPPLVNPDDLNTSGKAPLQGIGKLPNLTPANWEGKMRDVTILPPSPDSEQEAQTLGWAGVLWDVPIGKRVSMPWGFWSALQDAVLIDNASSAVRVWSANEKGQAIVTTTPKKKKMINYTDHGVTPGTEHLPESYTHFYQMAADRTKIFADIKRPMLLLIHDKLFDGPPLDNRNGWAPVNLDETQLRVKIAQALGTEYVNRLNNELYADV